MKAFIFTTALLCAANIGLAQDKTAPKAADQKQEHIKMHESMMKAHQQAADCLKSGKSEDECREAFRNACQEAGGPYMCGEGMRHKSGRKGK